MGDLVTQFGGKVSGELIRAEVWNGLVAKIEAEFTGLETRVNGRIAALEPRLAATEARLAAVEQKLVPLEALAASLLARQRRIDLSSTRTAFAIGERAEIVARVSDLLGKPLNLANEATRPWIDFMAPWGTLKAAPGFKSVAGTGGQTVTVQVNASGEARVLLRAEVGEGLADLQEQEVSAVLDTKVGPRSIAHAFLEATTPGSTELAPAFAAVTREYERSDTAVMRNYIDATYLAKPVRSYTPLTPRFAINWRDEFATVLAFMKPDDSPGTADGAMAVGSIRVTFRDWIYPWIMTQYLPVKADIVAAYEKQFLPHVLKGIDFAVSGMWNEIGTRTLNRGLLGTQRELAAAQEALGKLAPARPPEYMSRLVQAVGSGISLQRSLVYGQAVAPLVPEDVAPARGVSQGSVRGEAAAAATVAVVKEEARLSVNAAEARIMSNVAAETTRFSNDLLKEGGVVHQVQILAQSARAEVAKVNQELSLKAPIGMVGALLNPRTRVP